MRLDVEQRGFLRGHGHGNDDDVGALRGLGIAGAGQAVAQFLRLVLRTLRAARADDDLPPRPGQPPGDCAAEMPGSADNRNFFQAIHPHTISRKLVVAPDSGASDFVGLALA